MTPKELINHYGNEQEAAAALGRTVTTIRQWIAKKEISWWNQHAIQSISNNQLKICEKTKKSVGR